MKCWEKFDSLWKESKFAPSKLNGNFKVTLINSALLAVLEKDGFATAFSALLKPTVHKLTCYFSVTEDNMKKIDSYDKAEHNDDLAFEINLNLKTLFPEHHKEET